MIHSFDEFKEIPADYDSPINMVVEQMADEIARFTDNGVVQAVVKAGFDIDKDKLVSILQQDRQRYQEAYRKGYKAREDEIIHCRDCIYRYPDGNCDYGNKEGDFYCADAKLKEDEDE